MKVLQHLQTEANFLEGILVVVVCVVVVSVTADTSPLLCIVSNLPNDAPIVGKGWEVKSDDLKKQHKNSNMLYNFYKNKELVAFVSLCQ